MGWIGKTVVVVVVLALGAVAAVLYFKQTEHSATVYRTAEVKKGDLLVTIGANGTVEPEEVVDIGAQVAGVILSFGLDKAGKTIDYGSAVDNGTVLARIDPALYLSDVASAQAQLAEGQASLVSAKANLGQMQAKLDEAQADWDRAQKIGPSEALAETTYDGYKYGYEIAKANVDVARAALGQAQATIDAAQAQVDRAARNLGYCTITSPVKGVIIDRRVNIGQTVVSSLSAPSLFLLAKDLNRMQVWVSVNEMDIGNIHPGQNVTFTADAFPGRVFKGTVGKVRLNASMVQNVVTYMVEVITDNSDGTLLPYLTAKAMFELEHRTDVWLVPNSALRWTPSAGEIAPEFRAAYASGGSGRGKGSKGNGGSKAPSTGAAAPAEAPPTAAAKAKTGVLWERQADNFVRPIKVTVGSSDQVNTEVDGEGLSEGLEVVLGVETQTTAASGTTNPFMPNLARPRPGTSGTTTGGAGAPSK